MFGQKWVWAVWSRDSKNDFIVRMNWWNRLIFALLCKFKKAKNYFNDFWVGLVKNGHGYLVHEIMKFAEWFYGLSWFFACWLWYNNFWLDQHFLTLTFKCQSDAFVLVRLLAVAGRILSNRTVHPSLLTSVRVFSRNLIMRFLWILPWC